jgi:hypothetical protein
LNQKGRISVASKPPGLIELLIEKTFAVAFFSTVFHIGMVVALLSGIILEILYQTGLASAFGSWGWLFTWFHGAFGLIAAIGFVGVLYRFNTNRFITPTAGKMFCVDATFIGVICVSGVVLLLRMLDLLPGLWGWETTLHLVSVIAWLLASLFGGGLVAHALSSIVYPYAKSRSSAASQAFHILGSFNRIQLAAHVSGSTAPRPGPLPKAERELWMDYSEYWIRNIPSTGSATLSARMLARFTPMLVGMSRPSPRGATKMPTGSLEQPIPLLRFVEGFAARLVSSIAAAAI